MIKNMSQTDSIIRLTMALVIAVLYYTNVISGTLAIVLGAVALIMIITSLLKFCPLYSLFGITTCKVK